MPNLQNIHKPKLLLFYLQNQKVHESKSFFYNYGNIRMLNYIYEPGDEYIYKVSINKNYNWFWDHGFDIKKK